MVRMVTTPLYSPDKEKMPDQYDLVGSRFEMVSRDRGVITLRYRKDLD